MLSTGLPHNLKKSYIGLSKFNALKCPKNRGFVSQGLKKVLIIQAANFSVETCALNGYRKLVVKKTGADTCDYK